MAFQEPGKVGSGQAVPAHDVEIRILGQSFVIGQISGWQTTGEAVEALAQLLEGAASELRRTGWL